MGGKLIWDKLDGKKASTVYTYIDGLNFNNKSNYPKLMNDTINNVLLLKEAFAPYI